MVEGASWFGAALPQGLDRRMLSYLSANGSSTEVGWCNRTMTKNTEVNQQQNGFNTPSGVAPSESWPSGVAPSETWPSGVAPSESWPSGVAQSETWPQPDWDAVAWAQESGSHQTFQDYCWSDIVLCRGMVQKFLLTIVEVWSATSENVWLRLLLQKGGSNSY
jgi:hypothetical protein